MKHPSDLIQPAARRTWASATGRSSLQILLALSLVGGAAALLGIAATVRLDGASFEPAVGALRGVGSTLYEVLSNPVQLLRAIGAGNLVVTETL